MINAALPQLAFLLLCGIAAGGADPAPHVLWHIGTRDNDTREFKLAPKGYNRFPAAVPQDPIFLIGRSDPKHDWPYTHPGPVDFWAAGRRHTFTILFALATPPQGGAYRLHFDLADTHGSNPPELGIGINGRTFTRRLPRGAGDASIFGNPSAGREYRFAIDIPGETLLHGLNEITITTRTGSWFLYDWVGFEAPPSATLGEARGTILRSVRVDPWLTRRNGKLRQLLLITLTHVGKPEALTVDVSGAGSFDRTLQAGTRTIQIPLEPVSAETPVVVAVKQGMHRIGKQELMRRPGRERQPVDWVDCFLGTSTSRWMLYPGPSMPFGMVKLSPDNQRQGWKAGYEYAIENIAGFSHLHSWTMGGLLTMPTTGRLRTPPGAENDPDGGYRSRFSHQEEEASPGYYAVKLKDYGIKAELTSTTRAGFQRYTFPKASEAHILFDLHIPTEYGFTVHDARVRKVSSMEIEGSCQQQSGRYASWNLFTLHFVARLSEPFDTFGGWNGDTIRRDVREISGKGDVGAFVRYTTTAGKVIMLQTGISLVSIDQARLNLDTEMGPFGWDFDAVRRHARQTWNDLLSLIRIEGGNVAQKTKFYTNLYRSYCARTILSDVNGTYVDMCEKVRQLEDPASPVYGCDAFWNTFWNLNQLWTLVNPDRASTWVRSLLEIYDRGGWLAKGPTGIEYSSIMVASHEIALIVAAYQKGIRDFDAEKAYAAMKKIQTQPGRPHACGGHVGNRQLKSYMELGYVPVEKGPVSNTLEYAYDDWCVAQMAKALGKDEDYEYFMKRAANYRNVFDPSVGYARQKHADGSWVKDFSPFSGRGFVEGNAWQYTWFVPHDVGGLITIMGREEFNRRLDKGLEDSLPNRFNATGDRMADFPINHGNQPNMQSAYLFNYSGKPWLTQKWARKIMEHYYGLGPYDGYPGDEDQGQMGAWYVMSAMGLFEMDGGAAVSPIYEIGSPIFEKITIRLHPRYYSGGTFVIEARNNATENLYIQSASLNGKPLTRPWFRHAEIVGGGRLTLRMGPNPNKRWGSAPQAAPPSRESRK